MVCWISYLGFFFWELGIHMSALHFVLVVAHNDLLGGVGLGVWISNHTVDYAWQHN